MTRQKITGFTHPGEEILVQTEADKTELLDKKYYRKVHLMSCLNKPLHETTAPSLAHMAYIGTIRMFERKVLIFKITNGAQAWSQAGALPKPCFEKGQQP